MDSLPEQQQRARERRARVEELTRQGLTAQRIADILGCTVRTVHRARAARGLCLQEHRLFTAEEAASARSMLDDGASYTEVARTLGRDVSTVAKKFPGRGWTLKQASDWAVVCRQAQRVLRG